MFAKVMALDPRQTESYRIHADFWTHIGRDDMALRLLRAVEQVCPDPENRRMLSLLEDRPSRPPQSSATEQNNVWHGQWPAPRILVLCHNYSDYGMDTLYHGLCTLLGKENVVEYPWKPTLHGQDIHSAMGYPCVFDFGADALSEDQIEEQLRQGRFDLIIFADLVKFRHQPVVRRFMRAAPQVPIVVCDTWDDCYTPMERVVEYLGTDRIALVFKREMLSGVEYGPDTYPLPFSYPESYTEGAQNSDRGNPVFWAGKREYGLRHLYMDRLSAILGQDLDRRYDQDQYRKMLRASRIGISFSGCGFDTVRYWELPANGVMLMAERPPIEIPYNFEDGVSAVFFDDPADMAVKLRHYMARPDEVSRIAAAGHAHYLKHHTTVARARQFLGMVAHQMPQWLERLSHKAATDREGRAAALHTGRPIHLGLVKGENYGWGVCSRYFIEGLSGLRNIHVLNSEDGSDQNPGLDGVLFQALTNHHFDCMFPGARADINIGYTFFENELSERSVANAARYDSVLGGSTWCRDRMVEKGIANCDVLIQGIDPKVFHPIEQATRDDRFVIFSGGKFELRKGQDLVLRAVKIMQEKYPDVWLVNCWYNLWPSSTQLMTYSQHIRFEHHENEPWLETMGRTYAQNGLDADRIITHELVPQARQRELFARTDIGLFANRCEGGTNLVLMEYMACAKPVVASNNTGHKDIVNDDNALLLKHQAPYNILDANGNLFGRWHESSLDEIVAQLEYAYHHRDELQRIGRQAGEDLKRFTWDDSTRQLLQFLES